MPKFCLAIVVENIVMTHTICETGSKERVNRFIQKLRATVIFMIRSVRCG